jgi:hypothetical protein
MTSPVLTEITTGYACVTAINDNFGALESYLNDIPDPVLPSDPVRLSDLQEAASGGLAVVGDGTAHGQVKLVRSSNTVLKLNRCKGPGGLIIDGVLRQVPSAGVSATVTSCVVNGTAATALTAGTDYLVFAYMDGDTMTLDFRSASTHEDSNGVEILTGSTTHTLVGMVRPNAGPIFTDSASNRFVRTWYNDTGVTGTDSGSSYNFTSTQSIAELDSAVRAELLLWASEFGKVDVTFTIGPDNTPANAAYARVTAYITAQGVTALAQSANGHVRAPNTAGRLASAYDSAVFSGASLGISDGYGYFMVYRTIDGSVTSIDITNPRVSVSTQGSGL